MSFPSPLRLWSAVKKLGAKESAYRFFKTRELVYLLGTEVGRDKFDNTYYQLDPNDVVYGRDRVVWYANPDFDASQVPPEWHQWLHRMTDKVPTRETVEQFSPKYVKDHQMNLSGTAKAYAPRNYIGHEEWTGHAQAPIKAWTPSKLSNPVKSEEL